MIMTVLLALLQYLCVVHQVLVLNIVSSSHHKHNGLKKNIKTFIVKTLTQTFLWPAYFLFLQWFLTIKVNLTKRHGKTTNLKMKLELLMSSFSCLHC